MIYQDGDKFVACGKAIVRKEKNGWYNVRIGKLKVRFNTKYEEILKELPAECDVIMVGGVSKGRYYGWDIKLDGTLHTLRYTLHRGVYHGLSRGKAVILMDKPMRFAISPVVEGLKTVNPGDMCTFVCRKYYRLICARGSCLQKAPSACQRCGCIRRALIGRELIAAI